MIALASLLACKSTSPASSTPPQPPAIQEPTPAPREPSARPPDVPPAAPATLGVNDMAGHPARWNGQAVILFARLRHETVGCTKSVPPQCTGQWQLLDADDGKSMVVVLDHDGLDVPVVCRATASPLVSESPCPAR